MNYRIGSSHPGSAIPRVSTTLTLARAIARPSTAIAALASLFVAAIAPLPALAASKRQVSLNCASPCKDASIPCYSTITDAIAASPTLGEGDTVFVCSGTYREQVNTNAHAGTAVSPLVFVATGPVTIDCRNPYTGSWQQLDGTNVYSTTFTTSAPDKAQVFSGDVRYSYVPNASYPGLSPQQYAYDSGTHTLYVNAGGGQPAVSISTRTHGFNVNANSNHITLSGFTVIGATDEGIYLFGTATNPVTSATVVGCTSKLNARRGIHLQFTQDCSVVGCSVSYNQRHGIYLYHTSNCAIRSNESFHNDDPLMPLISGSQTGIKVGDNPAVLGDVNNVTVDYNIVHDNEDSGIDIRNASNILVRRNVSYRNGDHGFDNNNTDATSFINDVAVRNDHDGISAENTATNVSVYNCILAGNTINPTTLNNAEPVAELWIGNTAGLASDYNSIVGSGQPTGVLDGGPYSRYIVTL